MVGVDHAGRGPLWEWIMVGVDHAERGPFWEWTMVGVDHAGRGPFWEWTMLGVDNVRSVPYWEGTIVAVEHAGMGKMLGGNHRVGVDYAGSGPCINAHILKRIVLFCSVGLKIASTHHDRHHIRARRLVYIRILHTYRCSLLVGKIGRAFQREWYFCGFSSFLFFFFT